MAEMAEKLAKLTVDDFRRHLNKNFELKAPNGEVVKLKLTAALPTALPEGEKHPTALKSHAGEKLAVRSGGSFLLDFVAPAGSVLPQGTYPLKHHSFGPFEIFLTPNAQAHGVSGYHAVFG